MGTDASYPIYAPAAWQFKFPESFHFDCDVKSYLTLDITIIPTARPPLHPNLSSMFYLRRINERALQPEGLL